MRKYLGTILLLLGLSLLALPLTVLADTYSHYIQVGVLNNSTNAYTNLPVLASVNSTQLANYGYMDAAGLETNVVEGATDRAYGVGSTKLGLYIPSIAGWENKVYQYRLDNSPAQTDYYFIPGKSGDATKTDAATLEPGSSDFSLEWKGYLDTSVVGSILYKAGEYGLEISVAGTIRAFVEAAGGQVAEYLYPNSDITANYDRNTGSFNYAAVDDPQASPDDAATYVEPNPNQTAYTLYDEYGLTDSASTASDTIDSVTVYFRIRNDTAAITAASQPMLILGGDSTTATEQSVVGVTWGTKNEALARPGGGSWTYADLDNLQYRNRMRTGNASYDSECTQTYVKVLYTPTNISITKAAVASGEHTIVFSRTGSTYDLTVDAVSAGTQTSTYGPEDTAGSLVIDGDIAVATEYAKLTVGGVQKLWYQPITIVGSGANGLTDRSGNGNHGTVTFGTNPTPIEITVGATTAYSSYTAPESENETAVPEVVVTPVIMLYSTISLTSL